MNKQGQSSGDQTSDADLGLEQRHQTTLLKTSTLQSAIFNSANFSSIATDANGVIQIFNVGAERMLGYVAADVLNKITPADISDPQELIERAAALSLELGTSITPGFEALVFKASRGIEDIYELTYIRKDGSRFPAVVSVTALRDDRDVIIGYLLIGTDNTARKQAEEALKKAGALQSAIFNSANFSSIATDANGLIQIFNVGAERMLGYNASDVMNKMSPADISDPQEVIARAATLSAELDTTITPGFEALVFKASRGIEDIYELTYIRKDGSRFPAVVSVTALRDDRDVIIGYLLIGTDNTARKQAEEALIKAGALQNAIFNSANFSSIATDANGLIQIFNVGAERMLGYNASDVMNKMSPADISDPQEVIARAETLTLELDTPIMPGFEALVFKASRGIEDIYELTYIRKDGSRFPAVVSVTALRDDRDVIIGYLLIGTDNTARKQAEEALIKAGALQSAIFNSANFSSIATDANGLIQIFNVGAERMLGYNASDVMNKMSPADISDPQEVIARAATLSMELDTPITPGFEALVFKASRGIEDIYELTYIRKDGSRFPAMVSVTALRDEKTNIIGYLLIGTDNSARKEIEAAQALITQHQQLVDQQFYMRSVIDSSIDGIMMIDPKGFITDVNDQMILLTGRERSELIGAPSRNFFTDSVSVDEAFKQVIAENSIVDRELTVLALDGEETVVSMNAAIFLDRAGKVKGVVASARDVTERKRFENTLQDKNILLEHASLMKSEFLATMSHELRTPLNAIIGFSEALKEGLTGPMSDIQCEYTGDIFTSGQHLLSLINDILDLSKVEAGMMTLELEPVEIESLLTNSLSIVREKATSQGIQLILNMAGNLGPAQLDLRKTKQIVYNLLSNAVKFSRSGGKVTMHAHPTGRSSVGKIGGNWPIYGFPVSENEFEYFLEIMVEDSGIGIAQDSMKKLFLAFSQIDSSLARKFEGTGLGLAMVKQLVELQGGSVAVASSEGEGSRFAVWLPLRSDMQAALTLPHADVKKLMQDALDDERNAMLIEDVTGVGDIVCRLLESEGFTVMRPANVNAALVLAKKHTFSLLTLYQESDDNGIWHALKKMQESGDMLNVPAIVIGGKVDGRLALIGGASAVLHKPIQRTELLAAVSNLGMEPSDDRTYTVLIVDDDRLSVEIIAAILPGPYYATVRVHGGQEAITLAARLLPDLIFLDLMMPDVTGFDVVEALQRNPLTTHIPILVQTAKKLSVQDHVVLRSNPGKNIHLIQKADFNRASFIEQIKHALSVSKEA